MSDRIEIYALLIRRDGSWSIDDDWFRTQGQAEEWVERTLARWPASERPQDEDRPVRVVKISEV